MLGERDRFHQTTEGGQVAAKMTPGCHRRGGEMSGKQIHQGGSKPAKGERGIERDTGATRRKHPLYRRSKQGIVPWR